MERRYNYEYNSPFNMDDMDRDKESIHSVPFWVGILCITGFWILFGGVYLNDLILPTALTIEDEANYPLSFISERAIQDLKYLTDLGPKITGSFENEYLMVEFLTETIKKIISESQSSQLIEYDVQVITGGFYLDDMAGYMNVYDRIQNVIVKVHGQNNTSGRSILVNSHFDSVPVSPGGSDDGINVVNMLEILRKLAKSTTRLQHNVIFLFNGAEETPLQAAHGFVAHHKWANESKILINLEAAGSGGKLILFQTGPQTPWLVRYYSQVPHPYGNVMGEEIFQSGIIPSDTDFRVFRDFGGLVGVDMAYFKDGYRYHTKYDNFQCIPNGSYQYGGDNTLSLIRSLGNAPEVLEDASSVDNAVYYDIFGWFMISYSTQTANIVNGVTILLSALVFILSLLDFRIGLSKGIFKYLGITSLVMIGGVVMAMVFTIVLCFVLDILGKTMSWYGNPWLLFGLYIVPIVGISGSLMFFTSHENLSLGVRSQLQGHVTRLIWTIFLALGTASNIRSSYVLMIPIFFNTVGFLVIHVCRLHHTIRTWQIIYVVFQVIPVMIIINTFWMSLELFIPISGRIGSNINPEFYIAVITFVYTVIGTSYLTSISNILKKIVWYYVALAAIFAVFLSLLFTPIGFPYSANEASPKPQRHWIMHAQRKFFNESFELTRTDSGILMLNMDRNSPEALRPYVSELSNLTTLDDDCKNYSLCAIPLIHAKVIKRIEYSTWVPGPEPTFPENETLQVTLISKQATDNMVKYSLQVNGPDKLMFYITPKRAMTFVNTSLIDVVKPIKFSFNDRPVYVILYQLGKGDGKPLSFDFTVETPSGYNGTIVDFAVAARYVHDSRIEKSKFYSKFLDAFPEWAHAIAWVAAYQSFVL